MFGRNKDQTTSQRIERLIREVLPWQFAKMDVKQEHDLQGDLGIDSLGKVALAFRIEEEFGFDFSRYQGDVAQIRTMGDVLEAVNALMAEQGTL